MSKNQTLKFDFTREFAAQDMISIVMQKTGLNASEAVASCITQENYVRALNAGWGDIAYGLWGRADYDRSWHFLKEPIVSVELNDDQQRLLYIVMHEEKASAREAVCQFLVFEMERLGYHI